MYVYNHKVEINKNYLETIGENICILADNTKKLYLGNLHEYVPEIISEQAMEEIHKIEVFVEIKGRFYFVDKTFVSDSRMTDYTELKERRIMMMLEKFNSRIEDYII